MLSLALPNHQIFVIWSNRIPNTQQKQLRFQLFSELFGIFSCHPYLLSSCPLPLSSLLSFNISRLLLSSLYYRGIIYRYAVCNCAVCNNLTSCGALTVNYFPAVFIIIARIRGSPGNYRRFSLYIMVWWVRARLITVSCITTLRCVCVCVCVYYITIYTRVCVHCHVLWQTTKDSTSHRQWLTVVTAPSENNLTLSCLSV